MHDPGCGIFSENVLTCQHVLWGASAGSWQLTQTRMATNFNIKFLYGKKKNAIFIGSYDILLVQKMVFLS